MKIGDKYYYQGKYKARVWGTITAIEGIIVTVKNKATYTYMTPDVETWITEGRIFTDKDHTVKTKSN